MALYTDPSQALLRPLPNPQRMADHNGCLLPKVFIVYPHNPSPYTEMASDIQLYRQWYPQESDDNLHGLIHQSMQSHETQQKSTIEAHTSKVYNFVKFLQQSHIAVAYDHLLSDVGCDNIMKWCQEQIEDSDIVILIITESFNEFLNGDVPPESEQIFVGNYLSNFVNNPPSGKLILPVFFDQSVNPQLIPKCLEMSKLYSIYTPAMLGRGDDLNALYGLLTRQDRYTPPAPSAFTGPIRLNKRRRIGDGVTTEVIQRDSASVVSSSHHQKLLQSLQRFQSPPSDLIIATVSDKPLFSAHWRQLAKHLGLTEAQIERCEARGIRDEAENCLQMLKTWKGSTIGVATIASLADAVYKKCRSTNMLEILHGACESSMCLA